MYYKVNAADAVSQYKGMDTVKYSFNTHTGEVSEGGTTGLQCEAQTLNYGLDFNFSQIVRVRIRLEEFCYVHQTQAANLSPEVAVIDTDTTCGDDDLIEHAAKQHLSDIVYDFDSVIAVGFRKTRARPDAEITPFERQLFVLKYIFGVDLYKMINPQHFDLLDINIEQKVNILCMELSDIIHKLNSKKTYGLSASQEKVVHNLGTFGKYINSVSSDIARWHSIEYFADPIFNVWTTHFTQDQWKDFMSATIWFMKK